LRAYHERVITRNHEQIKRIADALFSHDEAQSRLVLRSTRSEFALHQVHQALNSHAFVAASRLLFSLPFCLPFWCGKALQMLKRLDRDYIELSRASGSEAAGASAAAPLAVDGNAASAVGAVLRTDLQKDPTRYISALERNLEAAANSIQFLASSLDQYKTVQQNHGVFDCI